MIERVDRLEKPTAIATPIPIPTPTLMAFCFYFQKSHLLKSAEAVGKIVIGLTREARYGRTALIHRRLAGDPLSN
ncbi:MAG: hypothetical protein ABSH28_20675 [Acidobacteriota bacterium]|jgi:hypothetical protein